MIKNIIFDFDGVIVDSEVLASKAFSKYFSKFDKSIKEEQFYKYAGKKTVEVIDLLSSKYKIENKEKGKSYLKSNGFFTSKSNLFEDIQRIIYKR